MNTTTSTSTTLSGTNSNIPTLDDLNKAEMSRLVPVIVFLSLVALVGVLGNSLVVYIYTKRFKFSNIKCFILSLSTVDMISCCVAIPLEIVVVVDQYTFEYGWLCKLSRCLNAVCTNSSTFLLIFIAIDRFRMIWNPFRWQINEVFAKFSLLVAVSISAILSWPAIIVYGKETFTIPKYNLTGSDCSKDDAIKDTSFSSIYTLVFAILFIASVILLVIVYCLIGYKVRRHACKMNESRVKKSQNGHKDTQVNARKTTFVMFLVTLGFILSFLPHLIIRQFKNKFVNDNTESVNGMYRIFTRSYFLNCAINPLIYSAFDTRFRLACKKTFRRFSSRKEDFSSNRTTTLSGQNSTTLATQVTSFIRT